MSLDAPTAPIRTWQHWLLPSVLGLVIAISAWVSLNTGQHLWNDHEQEHAQVDQQAIHQAQLQQMVRWVNLMIQNGAPGIPGAPPPPPPPSPEEPAEPVEEVDAPEADQEENAS